MSTLVELLARLAHDLRSTGARYCLVGGLAVSARAEPRFTRDVDVAVAAADDAEAERVTFELVQQGYRVLTTVEQKATGRLATARLQVPDSALVVADLLFASSGIEPELVAAATPLELSPRVQLPVATVADLIALKVLARDDTTRPQDRVDLAALLRESTPADVATARDRLALITARGFARQRELAAELDRALTELTPAK